MLTKMFDSLTQTAELAIQYGIQGKQFLFFFFCWYAIFFLSDNSEIESCKHLALKLCQIESASKQHKKAVSKASEEETIEAFDKVGRTDFVFKSIHNLELLQLQSYARNRTVIPSSAAAQSARYKAFETHLAFIAETVHNTRKSPFR